MCRTALCHGNQASTDGLSSICPPVHLRPHFYIFDGTSSEKKSVHSSTLKLQAWSSVRIWDGRSEPKFSSVVHMDGPQTAVFVRGGLTVTVETGNDPDQSGRSFYIIDCQ